MIYFLYGDDTAKISNYVSSLSKKNSFNKINYELNSENISEIIGNLDTPNLFGEKNLFIIDITDTDPEVVLDFTRRINDSHEVIILFEDNIDQRSKVFKTLSSYKTTSFKNIKNSNIFEFTDLLINKDTKKVYQELQKLEEAGEEDLAIFNMIVSAFRNIAAIKFDTKLKSKIIPFKVNFYNKAANLYTNEEVKEIYKILSENDLKFKTGEITSDMLLIHSINTILKNGTNK